MSSLDLKALPLSNRACAGLCLFAGALSLGCTTALRSGGPTLRTEQALASELTAVKSLRYTACVHLVAFQLRSSPATRACNITFPHTPYFVRGLGTVAAHASAI